MNSRKDLASALLPLIEKTHDQKKLAKAIAQYLAENRQTKELDALMRDISSLRVAAGTIEATVTSAFPISPAVKRSIKTVIMSQHNADNIVINEVIDPSVVGGLRIETAEQQLDTTVRSKLNRLKSTIAIA
jgi:F-type H+-transporting ATPase subunit delta